MQLAEWIKKTGRTRAGLARELIVTRAYITQLCQGAKPSLDMAVRLEHMSGGKIRPRDWPRSGNGLEIGRGGGRKG